VPLQSIGAIGNYAVVTISLYQYSQSWILQTWWTNCKSDHCH
jgi:hypothetical protein